MSVVEFEGCGAALVVVIVATIVEFAEFACCAAVLAFVVELDVCTVVGVSVAVMSGWLLVTLL